MVEEGLTGGVLGVKRGNLTQAVVQELLSRIETGKYTPGERLPSQDELCQEFEVSRTVVREAVASLRQSGYLVVRQGAGVFVSEIKPTELEFGAFAARDVTSALQILELRLGVEVEQVAFAAERRTPAALANIATAFDHFNQLDGQDPVALAQADFEFHLSIAQATNNPQFVHFLKALGKDIFLDLRLKHASSTPQAALMRVKHVGIEHGAILSAITTGDVPGARQAMRTHLEEGLARYRRAFAGEA